MGTIEFQGFPEGSPGRAHPAVSRSAVRVPADWLRTEALTSFADNLADTWHLVASDLRDEVTLELYYVVRGNARNDHERRAWSRLFGHRFQLPRSAFSREVLCGCTRTVHSKTCPVSTTSGDELLAWALFLLRSKPGSPERYQLEQQEWYDRLREGGRSHFHDPDAD
jgi:hypothetical protein